MNGISLVFTSKLSLLLLCWGNLVSRAEDLFDVLEELSESMLVIWCTPAAGAGAWGRTCGRERRFNRLGVAILLVLIESGETWRRARGVCAEDEIIFDSLNKHEIIILKIYHKRAPQGEGQCAVHPL